MEYQSFSPNPQSPQYPGIKAVAFFDSAEIPESEIRKTAFGFPLQITARLHWINTDSPAILKTESAPSDNTAILSATLSFCTRDKIPQWAAFLIIDANDNMRAIGIDRSHPGVLKASSSTSTPDSDPVSVQYEFSSPVSPSPARLP